MPKRQKIRFTLDRDYTAMLRAMMDYDGWTGTPSAYCARAMRFSLASDVADLASPDMGEVEVSGRVFQRATEEWPELANHGENS